MAKRTEPARMERITACMVDKEYRGLSEWKRAYGSFFYLNMLQLDCTVLSRGPDLVMCFRERKV